MAKVEEVKTSGGIRKLQPKPLSKELCIKGTCESCDELRNHLYNNY